MSRRHQLGFSLIELMIVIAIIGLLAMFAVPAYQNYVVRAKVMEGISAAVAAQTAVVEMVQIDGALPNSNREALYKSPVFSKNASVQSISIGAEGMITILFKPSLTSQQQAYTLIFSPQVKDGQIRWDCQKGTLPEKFRPTGCR